MDFSDLNGRKFCHDEIMKKPDSSLINPEQALHKSCPFRVDRKTDSLLLQA